MLLRFILLSSQIKPLFFRKSVCFIFITALSLSLTYVILLNAKAMPINTEKLEAIELINEFRNKNQLHSFHYSTKLEQASRKHNLYMINNATCDHTEIPGGLSFAGKTHKDRSIAEAYTFKSGLENILCSEKPLSWKASINSLMSAIYHRFAFMDFSARELGLDTLTGNKNNDTLSQKFTYIMGTSTDSARWPKNDITPDVAVFPWPDQKNVSPAFLDDEIPDPTPYMKLSGIPVSVQFNPSLFKQAEIISFRLIEVETERPVETWQLDHHNDTHSKFTQLQFAWFPVRPLQRNMKYIAELEYMVDHGRYKKQWSFYTESYPKNAIWAIKNNNETILAALDQRVSIYLERPDEAIASVSCNCNHCQPVINSFDSVSLTVEQKETHCEIMDKNNNKINFTLTAM